MSPAPPDDADRAALTGQDTGQGPDDHRAARERPVRHDARRLGPDALEREAMAWPPAPWERAASAWRDDVWTGAEPVLGRPETRVLRTPPAVIAPPDRDNVEDLDSGEREVSRRRRIVREIVETALLALVIFVGIRAVVQNFKIEGSSMMPTLESSQYVLVNKLAYRTFGEPHRGDIVVFESWTNPDRDYIKRIIGMPGDTVEIRDDAVLINGDPLVEPYLDQQMSRRTSGPVVLGDDEYWVMGDNRNNSSDSRQHGPMESGQIIGKAWLTYWPPEAIRLIPDGDSSRANTTEAVDDDDAP